MPSASTSDSSNLPSSDKGGLHLKIVEHPFVSNIWTNAKTYYSNAKESSSLLKRGCESVESNLYFGAQWISPRVEPVVKNETFQRYAYRIDDFGCNTLTKIEKAGESLNETFQSSKKRIKTVQEGAWKAAETGFHTIEEKLTPVDDFLKESIVGMPLNLTLDLTEKVCDTLILEKEEKEEKQIVVKEGPLKRTTKLSVKLQKQALEKIHNLSLRSSESVGSLKHCVDLIKYAATHLDDGLKATNRFLESSYHKSVELSTHSLHYLKEQKTKLVENPKFKKVTEKIEYTSLETIKALSQVIDLLSRQFQLSVVQEKTRHITLAALDLPLFSAVATKSAKTLQEISTFLTSQLSGTQQHSKEAVLNAIHRIQDLINEILNSVKKPSGHKKSG